MSRELVWKVYFEMARLEDRVVEICGMVAEELHRTPSSHPAVLPTASGLPYPYGRAPAAAPALRPCRQLPPSHAAATEIVAAMPTVLSTAGLAPPLAHATDDGVLAEAELCMARSRDAYVSSVMHSPVNLRWKVWLSGARTELGFGNEAVARRLLDRASKEVRLLRAHCSLSLSLSLPVSLSLSLSVFLFSIRPTCRSLRVLWRCSRYVCRLPCDFSSCHHMCCFCLIVISDTH
jgi:hypothetical protein